eukprot:CAMPEP_0201908638 /NCGR_PEP_ID=MMETSP0903-20130614/696_1 /ASSEMBLY_ACC=CAM_ASM_000552 /TAXON_ID=420261 /ORGANISM="Thalassiosira antarctica, Strain CCMP982" /LENGTH=143 /DNA_ID=CAMNT_0048443031 /DNA_START=202 /DNA_END=630 /DNA_ORIENTATION=+
MSSWGGMNFVPSQTDPPLLLFVAGRRAIVYGPARRRASLSEPPGCFFRAAAGGAATGRSGAAAFGGDAPIAARGATVVAGAAGLRQWIRNWWWCHFRRRYWHRLRSSSVSVLVLCRVGIGLLLLRSGVAADAALVALVMADMA